MMAQPANVLLVKANYDRAGGPETLLAATFRHMDRSLFCPTLVTVEKSGSQCAEVLADPNLCARRRRIVWRGIAGSPLAARALGQIARELRADLIHTHDMRSNLAAYLLTRSRRIPWIAHVHGWLGHTHSGRWRLYEAADRRLVRAADLVLVGSEAARRDVEANRIKRVRVVRNAVEIPSIHGYREKADRVRRELGIQPEAVVIGTVGRIHPGKGQALLIQATARLAEKRLDVRALIVGEGQDLDRLRRLRRHLGLQRQVHLTGFVPDVMPYVAAMDIFAVPSLKESLPLTALEAMALQRPVVASRVGDLPDVVEDGRNGLLVSPGSAESLGEALEKLVADEGLRRQFGQRARQTVIARFSPEAMTRALARAYVEAIEQGRRRDA